MAFLSLLTARGVFKEIQVGFLLVGHTHEDIDVYFSHLSKALKSTNTFVLADLMKFFMHSQELSFMSEFIQEIADFKSFVKDYIISGWARLVGIGDMHLFKFYVDNDGVPIMKYKKSAVDSVWLPTDKPAIRLWKRDQHGRSILPHGFPKPVPFKPVGGSDVNLSVYLTQPAHQTTVCKTNAVPNCTETYPSCSNSMPCREAEPIKNASTTKWGTYIVRILLNFLHVN